MFKGANDVPKVETNDFRELRIYRFKEGSHYGTGGFKMGLAISVWLRRCLGELTRDMMKQVSHAVIFALDLAV